MYFNSFSNLVATSTLAMGVSYIIIIHTVVMHVLYVVHVHGCYILYLRVCNYVEYIAQVMLYCTYMYMYNVLFVGKSSSSFGCDQIHHALCERDVSGILRESGVTDDWPCRETTGCVLINTFGIHHITYTCFLLCSMASA